MSRESTKIKGAKTFRENYYSQEILSDKVFKIGDKVFFILYPYNQPDNFKLFSGEVVYHQANADFTIEYCVKIHTGFDKREIIKDFFHNNWFKSIKTSINKDTKGLSEHCRKFSFTEYELIEETDKYLDYGKYSTFFRNHSEKFTLFVNEAFVFDRLHVAAEYATKMTTITVCNKLKDLHDLMCSDALRLSKSKLYTISTTRFFKLARPLIVNLLNELGPEFEQFLGDDKKLLGFFNDYILNRRYRRMEFTKSRKTIIEKMSSNTRKREKDV